MGGRSRNGAELDKERIVQLVKPAIGANGLGAVKGSPVSPRPDASWVEAAREWAHIPAARRAAGYRDQGFGRNLSAAYSLSPRTSSML